MESGTTLYDFLYSDHERVASFLSQLHEDGTLKESEKEASKGKASTKKADVKLGIAGLEGQADREWSQSVREVYDPLWANSKRLIEKIKNRNLLRDTSDLHVGDLLVVEGRLIALDLAFMPHLLGADPMIEFFARGMSDGENGAEKKNKRSFSRTSEKAKEAEVMQSYLKSLPMGLQFVLLDDVGRGFYFNIKREFLSSHEMDLPLKFPIVVSGRWSVAGIIDALPNDQTGGLSEFVQDAALHWPEMAKHLVQLIAMTGMMFGRAVSSHGLSPLCVFRQIN